ncbi:MAG: hypothetical protein R6W06_09920 [Prochlorococcaceae cyanobacterium]
MGDRSAAAGSASGGGLVLGGALAGAVLGASGLAWWLLSRAEQRRMQSRQQRLLKLLRQQGEPELQLSSGERSQQERQLHDKVHQLNQAIEDVRRQLENLQPEA